MKVYAVRKGRETGIFYTWEEAKKQVQGYSNAQFKAFSNEEEAKLFLEQENYDFSFQDIEIDFDVALREFTFDKIKNIEDLSSNNHYVHKSSLEYTINWIKSFIKNKSEHNKGKSCEGSDNIFSIIGDRGAGKSSFLGTVEYILDKNIYQSSKNGDVLADEIYVLKKIDPTIFDDTVSMIEFVIANLKSKIDEIGEKMSYNLFSKESNTDIEFELFNRNVRDIVEVLKSLRLDKSAFAKEKSGIEVLENIQDKNDFRKKINQLVNQFLRICNSNLNKSYTTIAILIDDLDLVSNENIYKTLQDCFNFLKFQDNIVVFISYREKQLANSVLQNLIVENKELLENKVIKINELQEQSSKFLEKGLPRSQRTYLSLPQDVSVYNLLFPFIRTELSLRQKDYLISTTLGDFLHEELMKQTRLSITPIAGSEMTRFILPKTLRSSLQYLEMINGMENYQSMIQSIDRSKSLEKILHNIKTYSDYFKSLVQDNLPTKYFDIIATFLETDSYAKNRYISNALLELVKKEEDRPDNYLGMNMISEQEIYILNKEIYNVFMSDVFESMYCFKKCFYDEISNYFIYSLKMFYSIDMLQLLVKAMLYSSKDTNQVGFRENKYFDEYLQINRGKVMPDNFWYNSFLPFDPSDIKKVTDNSEEPRKTRMFLNRINKFSGNLEIDQMIGTFLFYNDISSLGDVNKYGKQDFSFTQSGFNYKYRNFASKEYFYNKFDHLGANYSKPNGQFTIDLLSALSDKRYIENSLKELMKGSEKKPYLFYSFFDIDMFIRRNYTRQMKKNPSIVFNYSINMVNNIFTNRTVEQNTIKSRRNMVFPLFDNLEGRDSFEYDNLIPDEIIQWVLFEDMPEEDLETDIDDDTLNRFTKMTNEEIRQVYSYEVKDFLRAYNAKYKDWPKSGEINSYRLDDLIIPSNKRQITEADLNAVIFLTETIRNEQAGN